MKLRSCLLAKLCKTDKGSKKPLESFQEKFDTCDKVFLSSYNQIEG